MQLSHRHEEFPKTASLIALLAIGLSFFTYYRLLYYPMSAGDTLPLLIGTRVNDWADLVELLTSPLLNGTGFAAGFYRPVATLSLALDQVIWGAWTAGYYATNIVFHGLCGLLVFYCAKRLFGNAITSYFAAVLFLSHPLAIEVVPSIARRQDLLACLLSLASINAFFLWRDTKLLRWLVLANIAWLCALASKEIAIYVPALTMLWLLIECEGVSWRERARIKLVTLVFFGGTFFLYLFARFSVLGSIGGYGETFAIWRLAYTVPLFFVQIFVPQGWSSFVDSELGNRILAVTLMAFLAALTWSGGTPDAWRQRTLLAAWIVAPLLVILATSTSAHRSFYSALPPLCILLAHASCNVVRGSEHGTTKHFLTRALMIIALFISLSLIVFSPLFHRYEHWRTTGDLFASVLAELDEKLAQEDMSAVHEVNLYNLPAFNIYYESTIPSAKSVSYFGNQQLSAYLQNNGYSASVRHVSFEERDPMNFRIVIVSSARNGNTLDLYFGNETRP